MTFKLTLKVMLWEELQNLLIYIDDIDVSLRFPWQSINEYYDVTKTTEKSFINLTYE